MYTATLRCGSVLSYEVHSFRPSKGESVPCRSHGYCVVIACGRSRTTGERSRTKDRARPRERDELLDFLHSCRGTTIAALRRQRFTLRLLAQAERDGLLAIDAEAGTVELVVQPEYV